MNRHHVSSHAQRIKKELLLVLKKHDLVIMFPTAWTVEHYSISAKPHQGGVKLRCGLHFITFHY